MMTTIKTTATLLGPIAMLSAVGADAQLLNKPVGTVEQAKAARQSLEGGARCLLDERPSNVRSFLKMFPASKDAARSANYLNQGDCVDGSAGNQDMHFGPAMLRGALYKALYNREFGTTAPAIADGQLDLAADTSGQNDADVGDYTKNRAFAECVVRKDPDSARALALAPAETTLEKAAFEKLEPAVGACAVQHKIVDLSRATIAGLIAEVTYRLSKRTSGHAA